MSLNLIERVRVYAAAGSQVVLPANDARTLCSIASAGLDYMENHRRLREQQAKVKTQLRLVFWLIAFNTACTAWLVLF